VWKFQGGQIIKALPKAIPGRSQHPFKAFSTDIEDHARVAILVEIAQQFLRLMQSVQLPHQIYFFASISGPLFPKDLDHYWELVFLIKAFNFFTKRPRDHTLHKQISPCNFHKVTTRFGNFDCRKIPFGKKLFRSRYKSESKLSLSVQNLEMVEDFQEVLILPI
jgi:hypothetical protein